MQSPRRDLLKGLVALGALRELTASAALAGTLKSLSGQAVAQAVNPDFDRESYNFWSGFLDRVADPIVPVKGQSRGNHTSANSDLQPVFLRYGPDGFKNAAELDASGLISEGDVTVSLNTSTIKIAPQDLQTFNRLQNAQIRVDVAQKTGILPVLEAMAYTAVSGMLSLNAKPKGKSTAASASSNPAHSAGGTSLGGAGPSGSVQSISFGSDPTWQKMQNIILPGGEGRWALNLEAQKKDSLFYKVMQAVIGNIGQFAPMIGLPGIAMTALQSFNALYGAIHAEPVPIIKSDPLRVFATQEALQKTGAPGAVTGILIQSGTYILVPAKQAPDPDDLKDLAVIQGRIVPPKTPASELDSVAANTLKDVTYVTFDVQATPTNLLRGATAGKSG
jgi:hypothetical protein